MNERQEENLLLSGSASKVETASSSFDELVAQLAAPLAGGRYQRAQRAYLARTIAELLHERLLFAESTLESDGTYALALRADDPAILWRCRARPRRLDFWHVDEDSIFREQAGVAVPAWDPAQLLLDFRRTIGIEPFTLARFLDETAQTLYADACILARGRPRAAELARAGHQAIEQAMEGHPWVLVNKGRIGFGAREMQQLTPESGRTQQLVWLAARRDSARLYTLADVDYDALLERELGASELALLHARLRAAGHAPADYLLIPVHAWQYANKLVIHYASELAAGRLVSLGASQSRYRPQQSIRTFQNEAHPERGYIKTSLSILNTGQIRGLSPEKLACAPRVTEWLRSCLRDDPELARLGTEILGEVATVTYAHPDHARNPEGPYQYRELLGALFRESAAARLRPGESLATMASMLYVDDEGKPLVAAWAERAGVELTVWLEHYLRAYLEPLLHCFFRHEIFFVAHGENTMLVLRDGLPVRVVLKDVVEEIQVSRRVHAALPAELRLLFYDIDDALVPLFILTDVLDGFLRYLADLLASRCDFPEDNLWRLVAATVRRYQRAHPELQAAFARWDLFPREFPRFCLNKYRLVLFGYADVAQNSLDTSPKFDGVLENPLAAVSG